MLLPQEIAEKLTSEEYSTLLQIVEENWHQAFGVVNVDRNRTWLSVVVELDDKTHHEVVLPRKNL